MIHSLSLHSLHHDAMKRAFARAEPPVVSGCSSAAPVARSSHQGRGERADPSPPGCDAPCLANDCCAEPCRLVAHDDGRLVTTGPPENRARHSSLAWGKALQHPWWGGKRLFPETVISTFASLVVCLNGILYGSFET